MGSFLHAAWRGDDSDTHAEKRDRVAILSPGGRRRCPPGDMLHFVAKRLGSRRRTFRTLIRFLSALLLAFFVLQSSVAWALAHIDRTDCCDGEAGDDDRKEPSCPCPLDCSKGCAVSLMRAMPPASLDLMSGLVPAIAIVDDLPPAAPASTDPLDILHVPKR